MGWFSCDRVDIEPVVVDVRDVRTLALSGVTGALEVVEGAGDGARLTGEACAPGAKFTVLRDGDRVTLTVAGAPNGLDLALAVPPGARVLAVRDHVGPLSIAHGDLAVSVHDLTGPLSAERVASLDADTVVGPVSAEDVRGALTVHDVTGPVAAEGVGGDVTAAQVLGPLVVEDVRGKLVTSGIQGPVAYETVAGGVSTGQ